MAGFSLGGLASGIDVQALIDGLVGVSRVPIDQLDKKKVQLDAASSTITTISSKLASLKTSALALSTSVGFASFAASSSDGAIVASTTGAANIGSYNVSVTALARAQKTRSDVHASSTTALGMNGSLELQVGGGTIYPVNVVGTDTLQDIAAKISSSGARVSAAIMNDGTGYRLLLQGLDSGADNAFTITENSITFGFNAPGNTYETAQDAALTVDGMPIVSKSNQVNGVIPGLKLALTKVTTSPVTVSVTSDPSALKAKINTFISAYNEFVNTSHNAAGFAGNKAPNPALQADSAIRTSLNKIGRLMSSAVPGALGAYTTMASIGLKLSREGTLSLDGTKFDAAMAADPESVRRLFVTDASTGATGLMKTFMDTVDSLNLGASSPLQSRISALGAQSKRLQTSKEKMEARLLDYEENLKRQFTRMDQLIGQYKTQQSQLSSIINPNNSNSGNSS